MSEGLACRRCRKYILGTESWGFHEGCAHEEFNALLSEIQFLRAEVERLNLLFNELETAYENRESIATKEGVFAWQQHIREVFDRLRTTLKPTEEGK